MTTTAAIAAGGVARRRRFARTAEPGSVVELTNGREAMVTTINYGLFGPTQYLVAWAGGFERWVGEQDICRVVLTTRQSANVMASNPARLHPLISSCWAARFAQITGRSALVA
ncbi:hypothetical protein [Chelatococcus asaccharovorans]|uniref:hypothetical protein n=1 Tax=Chelatococcus asaccharovorans TaxID=28210 RepID=UPI0022649716|nr:hypothetical protein [Chelatococcus asaccharovorans]